MEINDFNAMKGLLESAGVAEQISIENADDEIGSYNALIAKVVDYGPRDVNLPLEPDVVVARFGLEKTEYEIFANKDLFTSKQTEEINSAIGEIEAMAIAVLEASERQSKCRISFNISVKDFEVNEAAIRKTLPFCKSLDESLDRSGRFYSISSVIGIADFNNLSMQLLKLKADDILQEPVEKIFDQKLLSRLYPDGRPVY